jgi:hypothetical protein
VATRAARRIGKVTQLLLSLECCVNPEAMLRGSRETEISLTNMKQAVRKIQRALVAARPFRELA